MDQERSFMGRSNVTHNSVRPGITSVAPLGGTIEATFGRFGSRAACLLGKSVAYSLKNDTNRGAKDSNAGYWSRCASNSLNKSDNSLIQRKPRFSSSRTARSAAAFPL